MKRIFKTFPLFLCVLMVTVVSILPAQAVEFDYNTGHYLWTDEELYQFGMQYDPTDGSYFFPDGTYHPDRLYAQSTLFVDEPYYPKFDLMKLPWDTFPKPVQDILSMSLDGYKKSGNEFKIPFVLVRVSYGSYITLYVGTNLGIGRRYNTSTYQYDDMIRICAGKSYSTYSNAVCYSAQYRLSDYSVVKSWQQLNPIDFGDNGNLVYFDSTLALGDREFDFYIYGGLGVKEANLTSLSIPISDNYQVKFENGGNYIGYQTYFIFPYEDDYFSYWKWFYPPTAEELSANREQQIIDGQQQIIDMTGNANTMTTVNDSSLNDYHKKEEELVSKYDPEDLTDDVKVEIDSNAFEVLLDIMSGFVVVEPSVFVFVISALSLGVISLILNR